MRARNVGPADRDSPADRDGPRGWAGPGSTGFGGHHAGTHPAGHGADLPGGRVDSDRSDDLGDPEGLDGLWDDDPLDDEDGWSVSGRAGAGGAGGPYGDSARRPRADGPTAFGGAVDVRGDLIAGSVALMRGMEAQLLHHLARLIGADRAGGASDDATEILLEFVRHMYEHGWQPADLMHVARRGLSGSCVRLVAQLIERDAEFSRAMSRAPQDWVQQLRVVREESGGAPSGTVIGWLRAAGRQPADAWRDVIGVVAVITRLPVLEVLADPPSRWPDRRVAAASSGAPGGAARHPRSSSSQGRDPKMLGRIRALLAKAEATAFPDEAEAFTAKAQELMTRYAIDDALLQAHSGAGSTAIRARRVHIDNPYAPAKVQLLAAVGSANRARVIWINSVGMATMVGDPLDLDLVDLLYTSLLVQATRALTDAGRDSAYARSASYRRAFLLSYAQRIGERLTTADQRATAGSAGAELVLARRSQAVEEEFDRLFPTTAKMRTQRVNAHGWHAGREAADRAKFAQAQIAGDGG